MGYLYIMKKGDKFGRTVHLDIVRKAKKSGWTLWMTVSSYRSGRQVVCAPAIGRLRMASGYITCTHDNIKFENDGGR